MDIINETAKGRTYAVHRDLQPLVVKIDTLTLDPTNARLHSGRNIEEIARSLKTYGQRTPIVYQRTGDGRAIVRKGNGTIEAALSLKWTHLAALEIREDDTTAAAYAIADNRTAELATWNYAQLISTLESFESLSGTGFNDDDFRAVLAKFKTQEKLSRREPNMDEANAFQQKWSVKRGDVWECDGHVVVCGDSMEPESFGHIDERFFCVVADAPYGVSYEGKMRKRSEIESDDFSPLELRTMLERVFDNVLTRSEPGSGWYVFGPQGPLSVVFGAVLEARGLWRQSLVWAKNSFVAGRSDFHYQHEPIWYGWTPGAPHRYYGDRKQSSLFNFDRPTSSKVHPTMKPVALVAYMLELSSAPGDVVVDPFAGSGTTFEAAWSIGRRSYSVELVPAYCACILERMASIGMEPKKRG